MAMIAVNVRMAMTMGRNVMPKGVRWRRRPKVATTERLSPKLRVIRAV